MVLTCGHNVVLVLSLPSLLYVILLLDSSRVEVGVSWFFILLMDASMGKAIGFIGAAPLEFVVSIPNVVKYQEENLTILT